MDNDGNVRITKRGRAAIIDYAEDGGSFAFDAELGGADVLLVIYAPRDDGEWARRLPWAAGRRTQVLERVAREVIRQEARGSTFVVHATGVDILMPAFRNFIRRIRRAIARTPRVPPPPVVLGDLVLREATTQDLRALAELHVRAFNETHLEPGQSGPTYATREWQWREKLAETDATHFVLVLETAGKELVGFIWCHPTKDNPTWAARLNKIYLLRGYQRRGLGRRLVAAAVARLLEHGLTSMALFTEVDNAPACSFYDQLGGERQLNDQGEFEGMFGWRDLRRLHANLA